MQFRIYPLFIGLVVVGALGGIAFFEFGKSKLRRELAPLRQNASNVTRMRAESVRNQALLERFKANKEEWAKAIHADLLAARAELAALETKAARSPADASATPSIEANRDPIQGMTRLEFLSDAGRATPVAAFQTLIWAAMKGREPELAACVSLDQAARAKAENLLATLSAEARAKYGTPEQLVGLIFSHGVLEATAVQFAPGVVSDGDHVTLMLRARANGREGESKIPMVRSADGWAMAVGEKQIDGIRRGLTAEQPTR